MNLTKNNLKPINLKNTGYNTVYDQVITQVYWQLINPIRNQIYEINEFNKK